MKQKLMIITSFLIALIVSLPITLAATQNLIYDANGNLITGDGKFRTYDSFNHLVQVRNGSDSSGLIIENYTWHPTEERLFAKAVYESNGSWKETVYYPFKNLVRVKNATGKFDYKYIYLNGQLISQEDYAGKKLFFHNDHLGSVSLITDENGNKVEETFYSPFGEIISGGAVSRYDYTGKEYDSATADYDFNARKMKPEWGVFGTPDNGIKNIYNPQNLNRYSYVLNNPYKYIDPTGKYEKDVHMDLTNYLALQAGYSETEANTIATADQSMDEGLTHPWLHPLGKYHFETREYTEEELREAGNLNELGSDLHMYQDTYSHQGLTWLSHGNAGTAPDKTFNDPIKANMMARESFMILAGKQGLSKEEAMVRWYDNNMYNTISSFNRAQTNEDKKAILGNGNSGTSSGSGGKIIAQGTAIKKITGGFQWTTVVVRSATKRNK